MKNDKTIRKLDPDAYKNRAVPKSIDTDPFGSYTGVANDPYDKPVQDADDL